MFLLSFTINEVEGSCFKPHKTWGLWQFKVVRSGTSISQTLPSNHCGLWWSSSHWLNMHKHIAARKHSKDRNGMKWTWVSCTWMKKWKPSHNSQNLWSFILKTVPCRHFSLLRKRHLLGRLSCYPGWAAGSGADRQWMVAWESDRKLGWNVSSLKGSKRIFQGSRKVLDGAKLGNSVIKRSKTMWDSSPDWLKAKITINPCQLSISDGLLDDFL